MTGETGRIVNRHEHQPLVDEGRAQSASPEAKADRKRRKYWMEGSFADTANNHGLESARWRGLWRQSIQDLLIATCQNLRAGQLGRTGEAKEAHKSSLRLLMAVFEGESLSSPASGDHQAKRHLFCRPSRHPEIKPILHLNISLSGNTPFSAGLLSVVPLGQWAAFQSRPIHALTRAATTYSIT